MQRVLFVGDSAVQNTGLGYVLRSIMRRYALRGHTVAHAAISGRDVSDEAVLAADPAFHRGVAGAKWYNVQVTRRETVFKFDEAIDDFKPSVVISMTDPWYLDMVAYSRLRQSYFWVAYQTIEVPEYPPVVLNALPILPTPYKSIADIMRAADLVIPVTEMAGRALEKLGVTPGKRVFNGMDVDLAVTEKESKGAVFGSDNADKYIFMTMGLNTRRKQIPEVVTAFAEFLKGRKDRDRFLLYLHTNVSSSVGGTDIRGLVESLGIVPYVLVPQDYKPGLGIEIRELYRRYRAADCYVGMAAGEGFCYGYSEAMLHGIPLIYHNYGGHVEYTKDVGYPVSPARFIYPKGFAARWALPDTHEAAKCMARMCSSPKEAARFGARAEARARELFSWDVVFPQLYDQVDGAFASIRDNRLYGISLRRII